jgi:hypothetical protein
VRRYFIERSNSLPRARASDMAGIWSLALQRAATTLVHELRKPSYRHE